MNIDGADRQPRLVVFLPFVRTKAHYATPYQRHGLWGHQFFGKSVWIVCFLRPMIELVSSLRHLLCKKSKPVFQSFILELCRCVKSSLQRNWIDYRHDK